MSLLRLMSVAACSGVLNSRGTLQNLELFPDPPIAGENQTLRVDYMLGGSAPVTGGTATYSYKLNYIPITPTITDLCTQTQCPIELGPHTELSTSVFPTDIHGLVDISIAWKDQNEEPIWCVDMKYNVDTLAIGPPPDASTSSSGSGSSSSSGSGSSSSGSSSGSSGSSSNGTWVEEGRNLTFFQNLRTYVRTYLRGSSLASS